MKGRIIAIVTSFVFALWGLEVGAKPLFVLDMCVWICMMISAYTRIERNFLQFAFGIVFFIFLMGREFLEQYSLHSTEADFPERINDHLSVCIFVALVSFWIAFALFNKRRKEANMKATDVNSYYMAIRKYAKKVFFMSMPFAFVTTFVRSAVVLTVGYQNSYLVMPELTERFPILYVLDKIGLMMTASFCVFSAAQPQKREFYKLGKWFLLYSFLTLFEGARGTFLINILVYGAILAYMQCLCPDENWFEKKRYVRWAIIGVPVVMIASVAISIGRSGEDWREMDMTEAMTDFVYQQGVTGQVTKRAYENQSSIPKPVSGFYTLEFLYSGLPARLLGNKVYAGNTEEHALKGNSMKMALAYAMMGDEFLDGRGTGSSYIIETFYDFGYIGIAFGTICYAFLLSLVHRTSQKSILSKSLSFIVIDHILWSIRAGFTDFLAYLFAPTILFMIAFIFVSARSKSHIVAA